jgi:membrane-associated phospholipid phosphatase
VPVQPIVASSWRRAALVIVVVAAAVVLAMSIALHGRGTTSFDTWTTRELYFHISDSARLFLLGLTTPAISFALLGFIALLAALLRKWEVVALAVIGPLLALVMTEIVLKPLVDRRWYPTSIGGTQSPGVAFPSGHETGLVSLLIVLAVLLARVQLSRRARGIAHGVLALWAVLGAVGLVRAFYHYATDTIGAVGVSVTCVLGVAILIDVCAASGAQRRVDRDPQLTWRS